MTWIPEDWNESELYGADRADEGTTLQPEHHRAALSVLRRLPRQRLDRTAVLQTGCDVQMPSGFECFGSFDRIALDALRSTDSGPFASRYELVVALDSLYGLSRAGLCGIFGRVRSSLVEGGVFLATLAASERGGTPYVVWPAPQEEEGGVARLHEYELQYRLGRAGFVGARLYRFRRVLGRKDALLCMAVRRSCN